MQVRADLHIHTALSPCAENSMTPVNIARQARLLGLDVIGICDHNSAGNVASCSEAAASCGVVVLPGIEVQTREEVHALAFFEDVQALVAFAGELRSRLPPLENDEGFFGEQLLLGPSDEILGKETNLLLTSCDVSIEELPGLARQFGGMVIPAHVDRPSFSVIRNLGFLPEGLDVRCLELSPAAKLEKLLLQFPWLSWFKLIASSDAHRLEEMGRGTCELCVHDISPRGIMNALWG